MADKASKGPNNLDLKFKIPFEGKPEKEIKLTAYAFDAEGNLLSKAPVSGGQAQLSVPPAQARNARIFFAPAEVEGRGEATLDSLERSRAYEAVWRFDPRNTAYDIAAIPEVDWRFWLWCMCRVRGRVVRPVTIGGSTVDLPVCRARVHICEVDWWPNLILRLPDDIVFRIRDEWLRALQEPIRFPIPLPDPPPFKFDPRVLDPSPINIAEVNRALLPEASRGISSGLAWRALNPQPLPPKAGIAEGIANPGSIRGFNPQPDPPRVRFERGAELQLNPQPEPPGMQALSAMSLETRASVMSQSSSIVRSALIDNLAAIRPYICYWDWFWYWYRCDEVGVVDVDEQGRFDTTIWYRCFTDEPDLYFWVEYPIGGVWTTVYRPSIACHTYWNYACGTSVTIRVTDPRVAPCSPPPDLSGLQVAVMSIGNGVSMHEIQGAAAGAAEGLTTAGEPFGGVLEPHVYFSRTALFAIGITHYRWSYRRRTLSDGVTAVSDTWHVMDRNVVRHYAVIDPGTGDLSFPADPMGPDPAFPGKDLFRIQPINTPVGDQEWYPLDAREDTATAFFQTHLLAGGDAEAGAGKYEMKLELFNPTVSADNPVNLTAAGIQLKVASVNAPFGAGTVPTALASAEHLVLDGGNVVAFRVVVRVDNNPCQAEIYAVNNPPGGTGLTVDINCGFYEYSPNDSVPVRVAFRAIHPHNFGTFSFTIYRGASIFVPEAAASGLLGVGPINGFNRDSSSNYRKDISCHTLLTSNKPLGSPDCQKAAFAENLYVWAMATDGWSTLTYLNASGTPKAFALAPHS
jgi:hypothetical protein